jgi:aerobic-type carbon monoxide dehydrogenase small subunit (CoxS/CutS family)
LPLEEVEVPVSLAWVNGKRRELPADGRRLLDWLRDDLGLTVRAACEMGQCGACTVLVDNAATLACCTIAATLEATRIRTIEDLGAGSPLQRAMCSHGAVQCGFCTTGMVMALIAGLAELDVQLDDADVARHLRAAIAGNVCRCTGYTQIVAAGVAASKEMTD